LLGLVAFIASPILLLAGVALFASCGGLVEPALRGLVSQAAGVGKQGIVQGSSQSVQSLAMIIGPVWAGELYAQFSHASPYWCGAAAIIVGYPLHFPGDSEA
jgi:MFS transporter, DHA1 family, tetracycline resistance protein